MSSRWLATLVLCAIGLSPSLSNAETREIVYVSDARSIVLLNDIVARETPMLAAAHFFVTPAGSSFTLTVDDAALDDGETLQLIISVDGEPIFDGCVEDGSPHTITEASPGEEHTVWLGHSCAWPTAGVITVTT